MDIIQHANCYDQLILVRGVEGSTLLPPDRRAPFITMAKDHDFNQVVFTDAVAKVSDRIGEENQGWSVAKYLLEFERSGGIGGSKSLSDLDFIGRLIKKISSTHLN